MASEEKRRDRRGDTRVSLHPLGFADAIKALVRSPKREDSQAEESGKTKSDAPESAESESQSAPDQSAS